MVIAFLAVNYLGMTGSWRMRPGLRSGGETKNHAWYLCSSAGYSDRYYHQAQAVRQIITGELQAAFEQVDLLLTPTTPHPAFKLGAKKDPLSMYLEDIFLAGVSLSGLPAISVPAGKVNGLPIGCQFIAPFWQEGKLIQIASQLEDNNLI